MRLLLVLLLCQLLQSQPPSPTPRKNAGNEEKQKGSQYGQVPDHNNQPQTPVTINQFYSLPGNWPEGKGPSEQKHGPSLDEISTLLLAFFTLVLAGATGLLARIAYLQWRTMEGHERAFAAIAAHIKSGLEETKKAANAALLNAKALMNAERPWMLLTKTRGPGSGWYLPDDPGIVPGMAFDFKVFGNKPVRITDRKFILRPVSAKIGTRPLEPDLPLVPDYGPRQVGLPAAGEMMTPEHTFLIHCTLDARLSEAEWENLRDERTLMCAHGFIKYIDPFAEQRETRVCYVWDFQWGGVFTSLDGTPLNPVGFRISGPEAYNRCT
jgi:hypothetical protein